MVLKRLSSSAKRAYSHFKKNPHDTLILLLTFFTALITFLNIPSARMAVIGTIVLGEDPDEWRTSNESPFLQPVWNEEESQTRDPIFNVDHVRTSEDKRIFRSGENITIHYSTVNTRNEPYNLSIDAIKDFERFEIHSFREKDTGLKKGPINKYSTWYTPQEGGNYTIQVTMRQKINGTTYEDTDTTILIVA